MVPALVQRGRHRCNYAHRENYLDLDPTYKDALGRPLIRITYNFKENDYKIGKFLSQKSAEIARAMNPTMVTAPRYRDGNYSSVPYQSTHNTGGTIMGADPSTSVVNRYLQAWDAHNLFIMGASTFPQNQSYNPTGPVGRARLLVGGSDHEQVHEEPGPLDAGMMNVASASLALMLLAGAVAAAPAPSPAPEPVKAKEFVQRCKTDWAFCNARIQAKMTELNAVQEACIPNDAKRDEGAVRVAHVLEEVLEEDPDVLETGEYTLFIGQIIALIWPCGVVS